MISSLLRHSSRYFSASVISAGASFAMTKYYTGTFSPEVFGVMTLYLMLLDYITTFGTLTTESSVARKVFDYDGREKTEYINTLIAFYGIMCFFILVISLLFSYYITSWISPGSYVIYYCVLATGITQIFTKFFSVLLVNNGESKVSFKASVSSTITQHPLAILLISIFKFDFNARFIGLFLGSLVQASYSIQYLLKKRFIELRFEFNTAMLKETLILAFPTLISSLMALLFLYVDRIFLKHFIGDAAVGLYGLALIIGKLLSLMFESISTSMFPILMKQFIDSYDEGVRDFERLALKYYLFISVCAIFLILSSPYIVKFVASDDYSSSADISQVILLGMMISGYYKMPTIILRFHKVVWFYPFLAAISFSVNAAVSYLIIPVYGPVGAAVSSLIGFFIYSFLMQLLSFKHTSSKYNTCVTMLYFFVLTILVLFVYE